MNKCPLQKCSDSEVSYLEICW